VQFGAKTSQFYRDEIEFPFFNHWLKGKGDPKLPEAFVFETGTNQWRREDAWPPKDAQPQDALPARRWKAELRPPKGSRGGLRRIHQRSRTSRCPTSTARRLE
jgi:predicted acyl esterase